MMNLVTKKARAKVLNDSIPNSFAEANVELRDHLGNGIFLLEDCDLGIAWELSGVYDEDLLKDELLEELEPFKKAIRNVLPGIPAHRNLGNSVIQVILKQRRLRKAPKKLVNGREFRFPESSEGQMLESEEEYLFESLKFVSRSFFLTVRFTPNPDDRSIRQKIIDFLKEKKIRGAASAEVKFNSFISEINAGIKQLEEEARRIESQLEVRGKIKRLFADDLIGHIQEILNSTGERPLYPSDDNMQLAINAPGIKRISAGIKSELGETVAYSVNQLVRNYDVGIFRHFIEAIPHEDFDLVWTLSNGSHTPRTEITGREAYFDGKPSKRNIAETFRRFRAQVSTFNPYSVLSLRLLVHNPPESFDSHLQSAANDFLFSSIGREEQLPEHTVAVSLPLNCHRYANSLKARSRKRTLEQSLRFLPIYTGPESNDGLMWYQSRASTPTRFNLFAGEGNRHTALIGTSRAGKSVWMAYQMLQFLAGDSRRIIRGTDVRTSYRKLCALVGGKVIKFSEQTLRERPTSPFAFDIWTQEDLVNVKTLILAVIAAKNPDAIITDTHSNLLKQAISRAFNSQKEMMERKAAGTIRGGHDIAPHPIWKDITAQMPNAKAELEGSGTGNLSRFVEDLQRWTLSLTEAGEYGFIFSVHQTHEDTDKDARLLIYDMDGIADPVLRQIASMMANMKIMRDLARQPRNVEKLIVADELGQQTGGSANSSSMKKAQELMGEMFINIAATAAKMNGMLFALTNLVTDYTVNPAGKAIWDLAEQHVFLPMGQLFKTALKEWGDRHNDAEWQIIKSLKKEKINRRSMFFIISKNDTSPYRGSCYLPLSPYMDALTTTSGPQEELYSNLEAKGMQILERIRYMGETYPYGEGLKEDPRESLAEMEGDNEAA